MTRKMYWHRWHFKFHDRRLGVSFQAGRQTQRSVVDMQFTHKENSFSV